MKKVAYEQAKYSRGRIKEIRHFKNVTSLFVCVVKMIDGVR